MDKKEINKDISVLHLVCYLDNKEDMGTIQIVQN